MQAARTAAEQAVQRERLRSDLSLSRSHEQDLEKTLNSVVNSTFWRASWPLRYLVSKCRQLWRSFPLFVFFAALRRVGFARLAAGRIERRSGQSRIRYSQALRVRFGTDGQLFGNASKRMGRSAGVLIL